MTTSSIAPADFEKLWKQSPNISTQLIDVRSPAEFRAKHLSFAKNIPLDLLSAEKIAQERSPHDPLYVICHSGTRSAQASKLLTTSGFTQVLSIEGGMQACQQTNLPVESGKQVMSLERQVRIAAGSMILVGGLLAYFVNPYAIGLSMFVGAGLVFAGITDTCGMGMALARMPWNR